MGFLWVGERPEGYQLSGGVALPLRTSACDRFSSRRWLKNAFSKAAL